jgi:hypothetical protein
MGRNGVLGAKRQNRLEIQQAGVNGQPSFY